MKVLKLSVGVLQIDGTVDPWERLHPAVQEIASYTQVVVCRKSMD